MRSFVVVLVLLVTSSPVTADVAAGAHTLGSLAMGGGRGASSNVARAGLTAGIDLELGADDTAAALVIEHLWRKPAAYDGGPERTITVELRQHFPRRRGGRGGFIGFGGGVRRVVTTDDTGPVTLRGYDFRLDGGVALLDRSATTMHLRIGLTYGCYNRAIRADGSRESSSCLETLLGQMLIGLDLAHRW